MSKHLWKLADAIDISSFVSFFVDGHCILICIHCGGSAHSIRRSVSGLVISYFLNSSQSVAGTLTSFVVLKFYSGVGVGALSMNVSAWDRPYFHARTWA